MVLLQNITTWNFSIVEKNTTIIIFTLLSRRISSCWKYVHCFNSSFVRIQWTNIIRKDVRYHMLLAIPDSEFARNNTWLDSSSDYLTICNVPDNRRQIVHRILFRTFNFSELQLHFWFIQKTFKSKDSASFAVKIHVKFMYKTCLGLPSKVQSRHSCWG